MASSLKASARGLEIVDKARKKKGWTKTMTALWWQNALTSQATLRRFWRQQPIQQDAFIKICEVVGLKNWKDIADSSVEETSFESKATIDWGQAPDISVFYGRTAELETLQQWIKCDRTSVVAILGMGGIGKTTLAVSTVDTLQDSFNYIIWRSLRYTPSLQELLKDLLQFFCATTPPDTGGIEELMSYLHRDRCLLVLDDYQNVLKSGDMTGSYRQGYENFGELIERIGQQRHQSCLLLLSREKPKEIALLSGESSKVRSLAIAGLEETSAEEIFREKGLSEPSHWSKLIKIYGTNPLILKIAAAAIKESFNGKVSDFLSQNTIFLGNITELLEQHYERLSNLEKEIIHQLGIVKHPRSLSQLKNDLSLVVATSELIYALQSLARRSLIEKIPESDEIQYTLQPVVMKYICNQLNNG